MKFNNIFHCLLACAALAGASSCVEKAEYTPADPVASAAYYFSTGNGTYENLVEGQKSFSVLLGRLNTEGTLDVTINHEVADASLFTIPDKVTFADGEGTVTVDVTFDVEALEVRKEYSVKLWLDGIENTPYFLGNLDITVFYNPWRNMGTGTYTDAMVCSVFDVDQYTYQVEVQQHPEIDGIYRLKNPYAPGVYPLKGVNYGENDYYVTIDARDPEGVYVERSNTGFCANAEYGRMILSSMAYDAVAKAADDAERQEILAEQKEAGNCGTLEEGNIVMPAGTLEIAMELYNNGAYFTNSVVDMRLVLPGAKPVSDWKEVGMCNYTDGFAGPFYSPAVLNNTYKVLVEQHKKKANLYRIVDPFGPESGYSSTIPLEDSYITFDVSNPECVLTGEAIATLINPLRRGRLFVTTMADYEIFNNNISVAELIEAGIGGKFVDNVITIPGDQVQGYYSRSPEEAVYPETPVDVVLDLNSAEPSTQAASVKAKAPAKVPSVSELKFRK